MQYVVRITRGKEIVASETFDAKSDAAADEQAKAWAAALDLPANDPLWMRLSDRNGVVKPFSRADF